MNADQNIESENKALEGGVFYPTGKMLVAVPSARDAEALRQKFSSQQGPQHCALIDSAEFASEARKNLANPGVLAALGSTVHIRATQLELAEGGCHFLLIDTPDAKSRESNLKTLAGAPVRYAVLYRHLVIEDLGELIPTPTATEEAGAPGVTQ